MVHTYSVVYLVLVYTVRFNFFIVFDTIFSQNGNWQSRTNLILVLKFIGVVFFQLSSHQPSQFLRAALNADAV